jgi:hypothetical protein
MKLLHQIAALSVQSLEIQFRPDRPSCAELSPGCAAMQNWFKDHPASVGETYFEHLCSAFSFALRLLAASAACFVHGLFPFLFMSTGSSAVKSLYQGMVVARRLRGGEKAM